MAQRDDSDDSASEPSQGITSEESPTPEDEPGPPPEQQQAWPGSDADLDPEPDHGERTYQGADKLADKKALITGGDSGIGRAVALAYAREGADVAIAYYDEHDDAEETAGWVRDAGVDSLQLDGDLSDRAHCRRVVEATVEEFGDLDILVNNAGIHFEKREFRAISPEQLEETFATNVFSCFWLAQSALPHLEEGDSIINTGSVVAFDGNDSLIDYSATKGAIHTFTKSLAQSVADRGIRVNCVAPGPVWTPLIASTRPPDKVEQFGEDTFWGRPAQPVELASSYVFLASADARFYTGEILAPTGRAQTSR